MSSDASDGDEHRPPWRLRDLRGPSLATAALVVALLLLPFVVALVRAWDDGWVPTGDEAHIAVRSLDVLSRHPPLTGQPSTTFAYGDGVHTFHPGPMEFYLLAVPIRILGLSAGALLTAAAINGSAVLISLWVVLRRAGSAVALWAAVLLQLVMWSGGTATLTDTLSSSMTFYPVLAMAVLTWALIDGDLRLLPLAAVVGSYAAQQHLAAGILAATLAVTAVTGLGLVLIRGRRRDTSAGPGAWRWGLAAGAVVVVCWAPVAVGEVTRDPGNLTAVFRFSRDDDRPVLGFESGIDQALLAVGPPTVLARTDTGGWDLAGSGAPDTAWRTIGGMGAVAALAGTVLLARRRRVGLARLAGVALVVLAAGVLTGANVPEGVESSRVALYRWTWTAAFLTWTALGWGVAIVVTDRHLGGPHVATAVRRSGQCGLVLAVGALAVSTAVVRSDDDTSREEPAFDLERRVGPAVADGIDRDRPVLVIPQGTMADRKLAPHLILRLVESGVTVRVPARLQPFYGEHRRIVPDEPTPAILVASATGPLRRLPGRTIARGAIDPELTSLLDELAAAAEGETVELTREAPVLLAREADDLGIPRDEARRFLAALLRSLEEDPRTALTSPLVVDLASRGLLRSPEFDTAQLRRLEELLPKRRTLLKEERVEIRLLSPAEVRQLPPDLLG